AFAGEGTFLRRRGSLTLVARSVNVSALLIDVERIYPNNLVHHLHQPGGWSHAPVGRTLLERKEVPLAGARNRAVFTRLDLAELLGGDPRCVERGPYRIRVGDEEDRWRRAEKTVTVTDLGVHVKASARELLVWAVRLEDLEPAAGATVAVLSRT